VRLAATVATSALLAAAAVGCTRTTELFPSLTAACTAPGPVVHLGGDGDASCAGAIAANLGRYALCTCTDLVVTGNLDVGVPSGAGGAPGRPPPGPPPPPSFLTPVGSDGSIQVVGITRTKGSVISAGASDLVFGRGGFVGGSVHAAGALTASPMMELLVAGDAYVNGAIGGRVNIQGTLHVPTGAQLSLGTRAHDIVPETVTVDSPCQCGAGPVFDVAAAVAARKDKNADDALSFPVSLLADLGSNETLDWGCGEYYVPAIQTADGTTLDMRVHGRVGIFVAGDLRLGGNFTVSLDPGSELDLVVAGSVFTTGRVFGSPATPSRTRLWVGSTTVSLPDVIQFGAAVYAPSAVFSAGAGMTFAGTLFAGTLSVSGDVHITYDTSATAGGQSCGLGPPPSVE
jgi:hypothetical protein